MRKPTIDEIERELAPELELGPESQSAVTILPSGEVVVDEERRALNSEALAALAAVRKNATY